MAKEIPYMIVFPFWGKCPNLEIFRKNQYVWFICMFSSSSFAILWTQNQNPGPTSLGSSHFPCGVCESSVGWDDQVLVCDSCNVWYQIKAWILPCMKSTAKPWIRARHGNASDVACQTSQQCAWLIRANRFDSLSIPDSPVPTDIGSLAATSSPVGVQYTRPKTVTKADLNHPLRILIMNWQSETWIPDSCRYRQTGHYLGLWILALPVHYFQKALMKSKI